MDTSNINNNVVNDLHSLGRLRVDLSFC